MKFYGFQKLTLLDFPQHVACTVFTGGCNFRCPFCHNASLVTHLTDEDTYAEDEILAYLGKRKGLLDGIAVTGGEPLLQPDLFDFVRKVRALGFTVKLDTNGSFPERLRVGVEEGLFDYVAMDVKNAPEAYGETAGVDAALCEPVFASMDFLLSGKVPYEFRTTVASPFHTPERIEAIAKRIAGAQAYYLQNFEDSGDLIGAGMAPVARETLEKMREIASKYVPNTALRGLS